MNKCPYCDFELPNESDAAAEIEHMTTTHPDILRDRLERAGLLAYDRATYGFSVIDTTTGQRVDPRDLKPPEDWKPDYRTGPDLPSYLTIRELGFIVMFMTKKAIEKGIMDVDLEYVGIRVNDRGPGSPMPAPWIEFSVGNSDFAAWRKTMDVYEVHDGAVDDEPIYRNDLGQP